jgi:hypothetical protein
VLLAAVWAVWHFAYDGADPRLIFWPRPAEPGEPAELDEIVSLHVENRPLREVLAEFEDRYGLPIRVDDAALKTAGIAPNPAVTLDVDGVTLRTLLFLLAGETDLELVSVVDRGAVVFTTQTNRETIRGNYVSRVYRLDELLAVDEPIDELEIGDVVQAVVTPDNWSRVGGVGDVRVLPGAIVVEQLPETHRTIESLLSGLAQLQREPGRIEPLDVDIPPVALPGRNRALAALDATCDISVVEAPLGELFAALGKQHDVSIVLDRPALADYGIIADTPISLSPLENVSLRTILKTMLRNLDLTFVVRGDVLLVTTPEMAEVRHQRVRLYPVRDLLDGHSRTGDELLDAVTRCIAPDTWEDVGGPATIWHADGALVVLQLDEHHERIERMLAELRHTLHPSLHPPPPDRPNDIAERRIEAVLAQSTSFEFIETPLADVARELGRRHAVNVLLDTRALDGVGIGADTPITRSADDVPLDHALRRLLRDLDLVHTLSGETLIITTPEEEEIRLATRCYRTQSLAAAEDGQAEALIDLVETIVHPDAWESVGGPGSIVSFGGVLVVSQTRDIHAQTASLLAALQRHLDDRDSIAPIDALVGPQVWQERLLAALDEPTALALNRKPLADLVDAIEARHHVPVELDTRSLDGIGVGSDTSVTVQLEGLRLESALRLALPELDLTTIIGESAITITTPEEAESRGQYPRIYPVGDLAREITVDNSAYWGRALNSVGFGGGGFFGYPLPDTPYDVVSDFLTTLVDPDGWEDVGGPAAIDDYAGAIVVLARRETHAKVERLLAELRHRWKPPVYPPPPQTADHAATRDIERVLAQPTSPQMTDRPLSEVAATIAAQHGFRVLLDRRALDGVGIGGDYPVSITGREIPLEHALRPMLDDLDLTFVLRDESLVITTPEEADAGLITRCYAVQRLIEADDVDALIDAITTTVASDDWEHVGGPGAIDSIEGVLGISQTREVHRQIEALLAALGRHLDAPDSTAAIEVPAGPQEINRRAIAALAQRADFTFDDTPLAEVAQRLSEWYGIPVRLDVRSLEGVGIDGDVPITGRAADMPLETALNLLLLEFDLRPIVEDSALVITTTEQYEVRSLRARVYPIGDLRSADAPADLADFVRRTIDASAWEEVGGWSTMCGFAEALVVSASRETHGRIERLLAGLRAVKVQDAVVEPLPIFPSGKRAERIFAALAAPADVIVDAEPLGTALQRLVTERELPLWVDGGVNRLGVDLRKPKSFALRGSTFGRSLELLLAEHKLRYFVCDDVLLLTGDRFHAEWLAEPTRLYPVGDVRRRFASDFGLQISDFRLQTEEVPASPAFQRRRLPQRRRWQYYGGGGFGFGSTLYPPYQVIPPRQPLKFPAEPVPDRAPSFDDRLARALSLCALPEDRASVLLRGDVVVVTGGTRVHQAVQQVLDALRRVMTDESPPEDHDRLLDRPVSLLCENLPLPEALQRLSRESGLPIWALTSNSNRAAPRVSCQLERAPLGDVLAALSTPAVPLFGGEEQGVVIVGRSGEIADRETVRVYSLAEVLSRFPELDSETLARFAALAAAPDDAAPSSTIVSLPSLLIVRTTPARHAAVAQLLAFAASQENQSPRPHEFFADDNSAAIAALAARLRAARDPSELAWLAALTTRVEQPTAELCDALVAKLEDIDRESDPLLTICHALMHCGPSAPSAAPAIAEALEHAASDSRRDVLLLALGRIGPEGAAVLVETVVQTDTTDEKQARRILELLRRTGPAAQAAVPKVIWLLDGNTRDAAARTLQAIDPRGAACRAFLDQQSSEHPSFGDHWQSIKQSLIDLYPDLADTQESSGSTNGRR